MQEQPGAQPAASQPQSQSSGELDISRLPEGNSQSAVPRVEPRGEEDQPESVSDKDRSELLSTAELASGTILLRAAQRVDLGRTRNHQEDAAGIFVPGNPDTLARKGCLYIVADGMGGHNAGEVASQAALAEIQRVYYAVSDEDVPTALRQAITSANQTIQRFARADSRHMGMGTTAALAVVRGQEVHIANVGDSRVYLVRNGTAMQITQDHSWVEEQVQAGVLTQEQARLHPQRNIITRALGAGPVLEPDLYAGTLQIDDVLLLNSDGLTGHVTDQELAEIVSTNSPEQAVRRLVDLANERGGSDNISVIVVRAEALAAATPVAPAETTRAAPAGRRSLFIAFGVLATVLLVLAVIAFLLLRKPSPLRSNQALAPTGPAAAMATNSTVSITATAAMTGEIGVVPVASTQAPFSPTATLRPTSVPTLTALPTETPRPAIAASTRGSTATPAGRSASASPTTSVIAELPAPQLTSPEDETVVTGKLPTTFGWDWDGQLGPNQGFEVRIWREGTAEHLGAGPVVSQPTGGLWQQAIRVSETAGVQGQDGTYRWAVAVVQISPYQRIGAEASGRRLTYRSSSDDSNQFRPLN